MNQNQKEKKNQNGSRESNEQSKISIMDVIVEEMTEYICDELCKHREGKTEEEMLRSCDKCRMEEFQRRILNEYS